MNKLMMGVIVIVLSVVINSVYAVELTPETGCCLDFEGGLPLTEECNQYEINEDQCSDIIAQYKSARDVPLYVAGVILVILTFVVLLLWYLLRKKKRK